MKKRTIITIAAVAVVAAWSVGVYNGFVQKEESVKKAWSQVENQYQRRSDLIPNLVSTVKGYAAHESETLESVIAARSAATQVTVDASNLTADQIAAYQKAQGEITSALGRLIALGESYPDLKANQNFLELQAQLEGCENRIAVERKRFNEEAQVLNSSLRKFPNNIIASVFNFEPMSYFEAEQGAQQVPVVEF
jgi:LemA protein